MMAALTSAFAGGSFTVEAEQPSSVTTLRSTTMNEGFVISTSEDPTVYFPSEIDGVLDGVFSRSHRTFTCFSLASPMLAIMQAPRYTMLLLSFGM